MQKVTVRQRTQFKAEKKCEELAVEIQDREMEHNLEVQEVRGRHRQERQEIAGRGPLLVWRKVQKAKTQ